MTAEQGRGRRAAKVTSPKSNSRAPAEPPPRLRVNMLKWIISLQTYNLSMSTEDSSTNIDQEIRRQRVQIHGGGGGCMHTLDGRD